MDKEIYVLGSMLIDRQALVMAISELTDEDFINNKQLFIDIRSIFKEEKMVDVQSLVDKGHDLTRISRIVSDAPTSIYIEKYIERLKDEAYKRKCKRYANEILVAKNHKELESIITNQPMQKSKVPILDTHAAIQKSLSALAERAISDNPYKGLLTGFADIDRLSGGLKPSEIILLEADTNIGKSVLAQNIAINIAKNNYVVYFGLEMTKQQLIDRLIIMHMNILTTENFNNPKTLNGNHNDLIANYIDNGVLDNLYMVGVNEMKSKTVNEFKVITNDVRNNQSKIPSIIFIDYLRLIRGGEGREEHHKMQDNFEHIYDWASSLNVPIVLITGQNKLGQTSGSNGIRYDVHQHYLLEKDKKSDDAFSLTIKKNRDGKKGTIDLVWIEKYLRFECLN